MIQITPFSPSYQTQEAGNIKHLILVFGNSLFIYVEIFCALNSRTNWFDLTNVPQRQATSARLASIKIVYHHCAINKRSLSPSCQHQKLNIITIPRSSSIFGLLLRSGNFQTQLNLPLSSCRNDNKTSGTAARCPRIPQQYNSSIRSPLSPLASAGHHKGRIFFGNARAANTSTPIISLKDILHCAYISSRSIKCFQIALLSISWIYRNLPV